MKKWSLLIAFCLAAHLSSAQKPPVWDYPVKPGTPEWNALRTLAEMREATQIPDEVLNSLTTEDLVEICLNYPLLGNMQFYNGLKEGLMDVTSHFNGTQELFRRPDNAKYMLEALREWDLFEIHALYDNSTPPPVEKSVFWIGLVEAVAAHESIIVNATAEQLREIAAIAVKNLMLKERRPDLYSRSDMISSGALLGMALKTGNSKITMSSDLQRFLQYFMGGGVSPSLFEELMNLYVNF